MCPLVNIPDPSAGPGDQLAYDPQPVHGDASFGRLLGRQRQLRDEHRQGCALEAGDAELLPLMLSLARITARAQVLGEVAAEPSGRVR